MSVVYRSDLLLIFGLVILFGVIFHILIWMYEPPDATKIDLSYSQQRALIEEWKLKYEEKLKKLSKTQDPRSVNNNDKIKSHYDVQDSKVQDELLQIEEKEAKGNNKLELRDLHYEIIHDENNPYEAVYVLKERDNKKKDTVGKIKNKHGKKSKKLDYKAHSVADKNIGNVNVIAPIKGRLVGGPAQCTLYDLSENITENYECISLAIKPPVKVCLYPDVQDIHISQHIRNVGLWEPHIVKEFQNILFSNPEYGFIDIGLYKCKF